MININKFRDDVSDISAKTATPVMAADQYFCLSQYVVQVPPSVVYFRSKIQYLWD